MQDIRKCQNIFLNIYPQVTRKSTKETPFYSPEGLQQCNLNQNSIIQSHLYLPLPQNDTNIPPKYSVSGCGDCLAAGIILGVLRNLPESSCVALGLQAAAISLRSTEATPLSLTKLR